MLCWFLRYSIFFCFIKLINQTLVVKFLAFEEEIALGVYLPNLTKLKSSQLSLAHSWDSCNHKLLA